MKLLIAFYLIATTPVIGISLNNEIHISLNLQNGKELILNDGSKWEIAPEDRYISELWMIPFPLKITFGGSEEYPYLLTNVNADMKVKAKPVNREP